MEKSNELPAITKAVNKNKEKNQRKGKSREKRETSAKHSKKYDELKRIKRENDKKYKRIENTIEESGIPMAFNVIFSELISKQILPENFFTYTSLRLKEIGKEIAKLHNKEPLYIERLHDKIPLKRCKSEADKVIRSNNIFMTVQKK